MENNSLFKNDSDESEEITEVINFSENEKGFVSDYMINSDQLTKISKLKFKLDAKQVFNQPKTLQSLVSRAFSRKNKIFYCFNTEELSVDIKNTSGEVYLPLLTKGEIAKKLLHIKPELRKSLNMVHIGAVKILLKAQFRDNLKRSYWRIMSSKPILDYLQYLDQQITFEEANIQIYFTRINQIKENFMLSHKTKSLNIKIIKKNIFASKQKIIELRTKKAIISIT
ncbi:putative viral movement protein [Helianthus annuus]|nr:putative viral movement protein [Helianthus annuus]